MIWKEKVNYLVQRIMNADVFRIVGDSPLLQSLEWDGEAIGDPDNQVVYISWHDAEGQQFAVILTEKGLSEAHVEDDLIVLEDHEGEEVTIILYDLTARVDIRSGLLEALNLAP